MIQVILATMWPGGDIEVKPPWMKDDTWACRKLIVQAGDDAHWTTLLHIHIEDLNLEDRWFHGTPDEYDTAQQWERNIFDALGELPENQRYQAVTGKPCPASCYDPDCGCPYTNCPG